MVWLILILLVGAYIAADAFFEVSAKLSGFFKQRALPFLRSVWGAVFGVARRRAAPEARVQNTANSEHDEGVVLSAPGINLAAVFAFVLKRPVLVICLVAFVVIGGNLSGCTPPFLKSRDTLAAELKEAERSNTILEHEADVANKATELAERTINNTHAARAAVSRGQQDIADAVANLPPMVSAEHFADLDRRYRDAYELVLGPGFSAGLPDPGPGGPPPVRGSSPGSGSAGDRA